MSILEGDDVQSLLAMYDVAVEMGIGDGRENPLADRSNWAVNTFLTGQSNEVNGYSVYREMLPLFTIREATWNKKGVY